MIPEKNQLPERYLPTKGEEIDKYLDTLMDYLREKLKLEAIFVVFGTLQDINKRIYHIEVSQKPPQIDRRNVVLEFEHNLQLKTMLDYYNIAVRKNSARNVIDIYINVTFVPERRK